VTRKLSVFFVRFSCAACKKQLSENKAAIIAELSAGQGASRGWRLLPLQPSTDPVRSHAPASATFNAALAALAWVKRLTAGVV
jgi:hypothetical protein